MRSGMVIEGGFYAGKNHKTAFRFSIIDFYFVTAFYSLYDICMARQMIKTTIETIGFALKQCTKKVVSIVV